MADTQNRTAYSLGMPLVLGCAIGCILLIRFPLGVDQPDKITDFALGTHNSLPDLRLDGTLVHFREQPHLAADLEDCIEGFHHTGTEAATLWLGNSQLHAINQMQPGDETASLLLNRRFRGSDQYFVTGSLNNANLQEHYVLFEHLISRLPIKTLLLPVVFDDMRETGVRSKLNVVLTDKRTKESLERTPFGRKLLERNQQEDSVGNDMSALDETVQEASERRLNEIVTRFSSIWASRPTMRARLFLLLYQFRNWSLGINPSSVRRMIPGRYLDNRTALETTLQVAKERDIDVLLYIVPLRHDVTIPYNPKQYEKFKREMSALAAGDQVRFLDLEDLVPAEFWGTKNATSIGGDQELDFMHFQAGGHQLLADSLGDELAQWMAEEER